MNSKSYNYCYFYRIENILNGFFYYGVHCTNNLDDGYMGSGKRLHLAYKKYGIENFKKEILEFFNTPKEAYARESEVVTESLIKNDKCYNIALGGQGGYHNTSNTTKGQVPVKDNSGKIFLISKDDTRYNVSLFPIWKNKHHTTQTRERIRQKMTKDNSTNTRIWVHKNGIVKYIKKVFLNEYLESGWEKGRVGYKPRKNGQGKAISN